MRAFVHASVWLCVHTHMSARYSLLYNPYNIVLIRSWSDFSKFPKIDWRLNYLFVGIFIHFFSFWKSLANGVLGVIFVSTSFYMHAYARDLQNFIHYFTHIAPSPGVASKKYCKPRRKNLSEAPKTGIKIVNDNFLNFRKATPNP